MPGHTDLLLDADCPPFYLPEFEDACRWIIEEYDVPFHRLAIFLPCAVRKPYSTSPSHRLFLHVIESIIPADHYHIVVFGTCGTVPAELERMYPFSSYRYMLGNCGVERIKDDFLEIETHRLAGYLRKTEKTYEFRVAYCIGLFREAMIRASRRSNIPIDLLLPSMGTVERMRNPDRPFPDGSLSMDEYITEFRNELSSFYRNI